MFKQWDGFKDGNWMNNIDVRDFIQKNYTVYEGDKNFLAGTTEKTKKVWDKCSELILEEIKKGILGADTETVSGIDVFAPGYIDKDNEVIVGLQTDAPLKRITNPWGGIRMAEQSLESYGYKISDKMHDVFTNYRKTHNQGVFDAYTEEIRAARSTAVLTGLPDAYGRGRIIGDYRRIALYGIDRLIEEKKKDLKNLKGDMLDELVRLREELNEQIRALAKINNI